jgi:hypothetical protein
MGRQVFGSEGGYTQPGQSGGIEIDNMTWVQHKSAIVCCTWAGVGRNAFHTSFRKMRFADNQVRVS